MICNYLVAVDFDHGTRMTLIIGISEDCIFYQKNVLIIPLFEKEGIGEIFQINPPQPNIIKLSRSLSQRFILPRGA